MYYSGHIKPFWDREYKSFAYTRQPITDEETSMWVRQGYDYVKSFTGEMYDNRNPMPAWVNRFDCMFGLKNQTYTFYRMKTLEIMPVHSDHFRTYIKLFGANPSKVCRVLIMLEDWKPGHYLEINGKGVVNWLAGDYFFWESTTPHAASNIGIEDRYTLQITGEML